MEAVSKTLEDGVMTIILNRPDKKNAMDSALLQGLYTAMKTSEEQNPEIIVIKGSGKAFCAGGDLVEFRESEDPSSRIDLMAGVLHESIKMIRNSGAIVIAVIEGVAVGAGIGLALACDLSIATKKTIMNMGYRRIGLTPDGGGSFFLSRLAGSKVFNELYLLSRNITMEEAKELGLVNFVVEDHEIDDMLNKLISDLRALPLETIRYFKNLVNMSLFPGLDAHLDKERFYVSELAGKEMFKKRLDQFFDNK